MFDFMIVTIFFWKSKLQCIFEKTKYINLN